MTRPIAYETAHRVADDLAPRFRRVYQFALAAATARTVPLAPLENAAGRRDESGLMAAIPWGEFSRRLMARLRTAALEGVVGAAHAHARDLVQKRDTRVSAEFTFRFDATNPEALRAVDRLVFDLTFGVTEESKQAIRDLIRRLFQQQGETPASIARQIRAHIGLNRRQSAALLNRRLDLLQQVADGRLTNAQAASIGNAFRAHLLATRAETIARTETMRASNLGQQALWEQARAAGFLPLTQRRRWLVTPDERLCPICRPIPTNGPVGLDEPFVDGNGGLVFVPPAHPRCRCTVTLDFSPDPT